MIATGHVWVGLVDQQMFCIFYFIHYITYRASENYALNTGRQPWYVQVLIGNQSSEIRQERGN